MSTEPLINYSQSNKDAADEYKTQHQNLLKYDILNDSSTDTNSAKKESFEDIFRMVGDSGRWQVFMVLLTSYNSFIAAADTFAVIFKMDEPQHWCLPPESSNLTECLAVDSCLCSTWKLNGSTKISVDLECNRWQYDTSAYDSTIVSQFNLVCAKSPLRSLAVFLHMIAGSVASIIFGFMGDRMGRARAGSVGIVIFIATSFLQTYSPNLTVYLLLSTITAGAHMGTHCCWYTLCVECVSDRWRSYAGIFWMLPWALGISSVSLAAWMLASWWKLQLFITIAAFPLLNCMYLLPESPRWLVESGRPDQAFDALKQIAKANGVALSTNEEESMLSRLQIISARDKSASSSHICRELNMLFGSRRMAIRTLAIIWIWTAIAVVYFGISFDSSQLSDSGFLALGLAGLVELPGMASIWLIDRWGRRPVVAASFIITAVVLMPIPIMPRGWSVMLLSLSCRLLINCAFGVIYVYAEECFPSCVRNAALGIGATFESIGGALAPYISYGLTKVFWFLPSVVYCAVSLSAGLVVLMALPETLGKPMPSSIAQVEAESHDSCFTKYGTAITKNRQQKQRTYLQRVP